MTGKVENYLKKRKKEKRALCFALLDVGNFTPDQLKYIASFLDKEGADAILVGGSSHIDQFLLDSQIDKIKSVSQLPVILFPGNITGLSPKADAVFFMSLLNSLDPYYLIGAQVLGAPIVKRYNLEVLPTGYIIIYAESAAAFIGRAYPLPEHKPELVAMYGLAASYLGMRYLYLEAGSGAKKTVKEEMIAATRKLYDGILIVGGGITSHDVALNKIKAGADAIVVGNLLEKENFEEEMKEIIRVTE